MITLVSIMIGVQSYRLNGAKKELHAEISAHATTIAVYNLKAANAAEEYRLIENEWHNALRKIDEVRDEETARTQTVADAMGRDLTRMRDALKTYARGSGSLAPDAACRSESDRTAAFGVLLDLYMRADIESARVLESQATDIRALRKWVDEVKAPYDRSKDH